MKKALVLGLICSGVACSIFRARVAPYPTGVVFPLAEAARFALDGRLVRSLVRVEGKLYFSTDRGFVYCLEEDGRKILWTYAAGAALGCPPAVGGRSVAVWDRDNGVHGIDPQGNLIWKTRLPESIISDLCAARDRFYVGTTDGRLYAMDSDTGDVLWTFKTDAPVEAACAVWRNSIVQASVDGRIYFLNSEGKLLQRVEAGAAVRVTPLVDGDRLYFGTEDGRYNCLDLRTRRRKWRMRTDGKVLSPSVADAKRVYFTASNTVLYALDKSSGDIAWWAILPSRSPFRPELAGEKVLASSLSPLLLCLDRKAGEEAGRYDSGLEVRSNPVWSAPDIFLAEYDPVAAKGSLAVLSKEVKVELAASPAAPGTVGREVALTASSVGFHLPRYEFFIRRDGETVVTQKQSTRNSWTWFPDKVGKFVLGVRVKDAKETREAEVSYEIAK
jgi:outer membrane protein assembly factor BamB